MNIRKLSIPEKLCGFGEGGKESVVSRIYAFDNTRPASFNSQSRLK